VLLSAKLACTLTDRPRLNTNGEQFGKNGICWLWIGGSTLSLAGAARFKPNRQMALQLPWEEPIPHLFAWLISGGLGKH
jgi:hypothetical protein